MFIIADPSSVATLLTSNELWVYKVKYRSAGLINRQYSSVSDRLNLNDKSWYFINYDTKRMQAIQICQKEDKVFNTECQFSRRKYPRISPSAAVLKSINR